MAWKAIIIHTNYNLSNCIILPTYFEIEGKDKNDLENILNILGYSFVDTISCTVDEIYKEKGIDINNIKELKF